MNLPLLGLWVIVVGLTVTVVIVTILTWCKIATNRSVDVNDPCLVPLNTLPPVPAQCCYQSGNLTDLRYDGETDLVVGSTPRPIHSVCAGFCTQGVSADGKTCTSGAGQLAYQKCLSELTPAAGCTVPKPVAVLGTEYYYAQEATDVNCQDRRSC